MPTATKSPPPDILTELRRPFTPAAVRSKIQAGGGNANAKAKAMVVWYIDARLVIDRLNHVCGLDWSATYSPLANALECHLTVNGTTRTDVGEPGSGKQGGSPKAIYSDALKRAAVQFGVGISIYAAPKVWAETDEIRYGYDGKPNGLTIDGERRARGVYDAWLKTHGENAFGKALDHGDTDESSGDHDVEAPDIEPSREKPPPAVAVAPKPKGEQAPPREAPPMPPAPDSAESFQQHIDKIAPADTDLQKPKVIAGNQRAKLFVEARKVGITEDDLHVIAKLVANVDSLTALPRDKMDLMLQKIADYAACTPDQRARLWERAGRQAPA